MKINNVLIFILLITLFIFFMRIYKEGMNNADYNAQVDQKNEITGKITGIVGNLQNKDYSLYNTETAAMKVQQWNLFIIISILTLVVLLFTIKYVIS
jgi:hypothetical protein